MNSTTEENSTIHFKYGKKKEPLRPGEALELTETMAAHTSLNRFKPDRVSALRGK